MKTRSIESSELSGHAQRVIAVMRHCDGWVVSSAWNTDTHLHTRSVKLPSGLDALTQHIEREVLMTRDAFVVLEWSRGLQSVVAWCRRHQVSVYAVLPQDLQAAFVGGVGGNAERWDVEVMAVQALSGGVPLRIPEQVSSQWEERKVFRNLVRQRMDALERRRHQGGPDASDEVRAVLEEQYRIAAEAVEDWLEDDEALEGRVEAMREIPGVSYADALVMVSELADVDLRGKKAFQSYCGLVPRLKVSAAPWDVPGSPRLRASFHRIAVRRMQLDRCEVQGVPERAKEMNKTACKAAKAVYGLLKSWQDEQVGGDLPE